MSEFSKEIIEEIKSENELKELQYAIPDKAKILKSKFIKIIEYNKKSSSKLLKEIKSYISPQDRNRMNDYLGKFEGIEDAWNIFIDAEFIIKKSVTLTLCKMYNILCEKNNDLLNEVLGAIKDPKAIVHIKVYDFYKNSNDFHKLIDNLEARKFFHIASQLSKNQPNAKIQILTHMNTDFSFSFYEKIYKNKKKIKVDIKYIPESVTQNIYIKSLFFILIKYRVPKSNNYKEAIFYIEPSTNWHVITNTYSVGFSAQFAKLLNMRFDEQFANNELIFSPEDKKLTENDFKKDINYILDKLDLLLSENKINVDILDSSDILKLINKLKTKYMSINYAYKLLKSIYYFVLYIKYIDAESKNNKKLKNTIIIVREILNRNYFDKLSNILNSIRMYNENEDINVKKLRRGVIEDINSLLPICDIFPTKNWIRKDEILSNLNEIALDANLLHHFYSSIDQNIQDPVEMKKIFQEKVLPKIINGEKIKIFN